MYDYFRMRGIDYGAGTGGGRYLWGFRGADRRPSARYFSRVMRQISATSVYRIRWNALQFRDGVTTADRPRPRPSLGGAPGRPITCSRRPAQQVKLTLTTKVYSVTFPWLSVRRSVIMCGRRLHGFGLALSVASIDGPTPSKPSRSENHSI